VIWASFSSSQRASANRSSSLPSTFSWRRTPTVRLRMGHRRRRPLAGPAEGTLAAGHQPSGWISVHRPRFPRPYKCFAAGWNPAHRPGLPRPYGQPPARQNPAHRNPTKADGRQLQGTWHAHSAAAVRPRKAGKLPLVAKAVRRNLARQTNDPGSPSPPRCRHPLAVQPGACGRAGSLGAPLT
jgi:hypothetical protein